MVLIMEKDYVVKKSNDFVMNSRYNLTVEEQKIILTLASMVKPNDEEFKSYKFNITEFIKILDIKDQSKYTEIPKITKGLINKSLEIIENGELVQLSWLCTAKYKRGYVELRFAPELKQYMLKLSNMYTQYKLNNILQMKSKNSIRIYEFLKCNQFKNQFEIDVTELKQLLKLENAYARFYDFKKNVLLYAQKEINQYTDIIFSFECVKFGSKVIKIKFLITPKSKLSKPDTKPEEKLDELIDEFQTIIKEHIKISDCKAILKAANYNIDLIEQKYQIAKTQNINNLVGWLLDAIKNDYNKPIPSTNKNSFNNFEQRSYNYDELEKQLLNNFA